MQRRGQHGDLRFDEHRQMVTGNRDGRDRRHHALPSPSRLCLHIQDGRNGGGAVLFLRGKERDGHGILGAHGTVLRRQVGAIHR